jgi:hypothetical protein
MRVAFYFFKEGGKEMNSQVEDKMNTIFIALLMVLIIAFWFFVIPS